MNPAQTQAPTKRAKLTLICIRIRIALPALLNSVEAAEQKVSFNVHQRTRFKFIDCRYAEG
jgi:hypothetical protein